MDVGLHLLDVARFLFGEAVRLYCRTARVDPRVRGEDTATMLVDFHSGVTCVVELSTATRTEPEPFPECLVRIEGTDGTVELEQGYRLVLSRPGHREVRPVDAEVRPGRACPGMWCRTAFSRYSATGSTACGRAGSRTPQGRITCGRWD